MGVHPDKTAIRAVDACGGTFPKARNDYDDGWQRGHEVALDAAMEAVRPADALTAELLAALIWTMRQIDESYIETDAARAKYDAALAAIVKATGAE